LAAHLVAAPVSFLIRMSSHVTLYTLEQVRLSRFREGLARIPMPAFHPNISDLSRERPLLVLPFPAAVQL
jgi:hypothetical protein